MPSAGVMSSCLATEATTMSGTEVKGWSDVTQWKRGKDEVQFCLEYMSTHVHVHVRVDSFIAEAQLVRQVLSHIHVVVGFNFCGLGFTAAVLEATMSITVSQECNPTSD